jgi:hypothetical protein
MNKAITDDMVQQCEAILAATPYTPAFFMGIPLERFSQAALVRITGRAMHAVKDAEREAEEERKLWTGLRKAIG